MSIVQAQKVAEALAGAAWDMLRLAAGYGPEGQAVLETLSGIARVDQRTASLPDALREARRALVAVMERSRAQTPPPAPTRQEPASNPNSVSLSTTTSHPPVPETKPVGTGKRAAPRSGGRRTTAARAIAELRGELDELAAREPNATIEISWRVVED